MDELHDNAPAPEKGYTPRPTWQVWMARLGLLFMILFVIYQLLTVATGGLS